MKISMGSAACKVLLILIGSMAIVDAVTDQNSSNKVECQSPFVEVGGRCLHLDYTVSGTWAQMQQFCQALGGDLVNLGDVQFYEDVLMYIRALNIPMVHFWIGASDQEQEGHWMWTDKTPVKMGTPFWANYGSDNIQMPAGGRDQNCALLDVSLHYYFNDYDCTSDTKSVICQQ